MQLTYHITICFLGVTLSPVIADLLYSDASRDDGPCTYPPPVPLLNANFLVNPVQKYYLPVASENFYRFEYQMVRNKPAQTEDDIKSLQTRVEVSKIDLIQHLSGITVSFFGTPDEHYSYTLVPSFTSNAIEDPVFDFNATAVHGSSGSAPTRFGGEVKFTNIWNDNSPAWTIYTCIGGRQMFHIITGAQALTDDQLAANTKLLTEMGFDTKNFQFLTYP